MPKYTTFTIFEKEMRNFITAITKDNKLEQNSLTNWAYDEGIKEYKKAEGENYKSYATDCVKKFGHSPLISPCEYQGHHFSGLVAFKKALIKIFSPSDESLTNFITSHFNNILLAAIETHQEFIAIEAAAHSEFNDYIDKNGRPEPLKALEKSIEIYERKQPKYPDLENDFHNKIILMKEVRAQMLNDLSPAQAPSASASSAQFFKGAEKAAVPTAATTPSP